MRLFAGLITIPDKIYELFLFLDVNDPIVIFTNSQPRLQLTNRIRDGELIDIAPTATTHIPYHMLD